MSFNGKESKYEPIVFVNNPISNLEDDVIGFDTEVNTLQAAIEDGATMIGLIADYGTGKSSVTEIFQKTIAGEEYDKPIRINMWDCLNIDAYEDSDEKVSYLTKSFLYQLSNGHNKSFARYINKLMSKNYGNISFSVNKKKQFLTYIFLAALFYAFYEISLVSGTGITQYLSDWMIVSIPFIKVLSPLFIFVSLVLLLIGVKDACIAFSHWKMPDLRETQINDIFDIYNIIIEEITPENDKKKLVFIDDLDRIDDKEIIIKFLKELYRFQESLTEERSKFVFIISIKPESQIKDESKPEAETERVYQKIFDAIIYLSPIHFDDYDSILLSLLNNNQKNKVLLENLIETNINGVLPESFKWIKAGTNLTLRDLKDRLNHAISIMVSLKNKSYIGNSSADFKACAAVAYLENQYPEEYYQLIAAEKEFAEFMRCSYKIVDSTSSLDETDKLSETFGETFKDKTFTDEFKTDFFTMVLGRVFNDDFRMYFYTYPKGSHIKTTEERELCDCLFFPNRKMIDFDLDESVKRAFKSGKNETVEKTMAEIEHFPVIVLVNEVLFGRAEQISIVKLFDAFSKEVIEKTDGISKRRDCWKNIYLLSSSNKEVFIKDCVDKVLSLDTTISIIRKRTEIISAVGNRILDFSEMFCGDERSPQISQVEIEFIEDKTIAINLINLDKIEKEQFEYLSKLINSKALSDDEMTLQKAIEVMHCFVKLLEPVEIGDNVLLFLQTNKIRDEQLFETVCGSEVEKIKIAQYINLFNPTDFSVEYLNNIDSMGFDDYINENIALVLLQNELFYTPMLYFAAKENLKPFETYLGYDEIFDVCKDVFKVSELYLKRFRKFCIFEAKAYKYKDLFFGDYPLLAEEEYTRFDNAPDGLEYINLESINSRNYPKLLDLLYARKYTPEEILFLFNYLFDENANENCIKDSVLRKELIDSFDFKEINVRRLSFQQRSELYAIIKKDCAINTFERAVDFTKHIDCFIPEVEKMINSLPEKSESYCRLISDIDELSETAFSWLEENYMVSPLSEKLCKELYEKEFYRDFIVADVLRKQDMIIDEKIPFQDYIEVYINVDEVFDIMAGHWDFLEGLQIEADLSSFDKEHIIPIFKVPQTERFFEYIFCGQDDLELKKMHLAEAGVFKTEQDGIAFQKLICKPENMELLGSLEMYHRIYNKFEEKKLSCKGLFTRAWNVRWKSELGDPRSVLQQVFDRE